MGFELNIDFSGQLGQLQQLRRSAIDKAPEAVQEMGRSAVEDTSYAVPEGVETGVLDIQEMVSDVTSTGTGASLDVAVVLDWVVNSDNPCPDCLEREANGPYTADTIPGTPGDGSTQCGPNCSCTVEERQASWQDGTVMQAAANIMDGGLQL